MAVTRIEQNKTFTNVSLQLDGTSFFGCTFAGCDVNYSGGMFDAVDCNWSNNRFHFRDAAWRVAAFFADMNWLRSDVPLVISFGDGTHN